MYLVDTNLAVRAILPLDPQYRVISEAIDSLRLQGETLVITAQVMVEFQAIATRPVSANGFGWATSQANAESRRLEAIFPMLVETPDIYPAWRHLNETYSIAGRQVFDARLVAVMQVHGVTHLLTTNGSHFRRFVGITVIDPAEVSQAHADTESNTTA